jgi:hypothetical protein
MRFLSSGMCDLGHIIKKSDKLSTGGSRLWSSLLSRQRSGRLQFEANPRQIVCEILSWKNKIQNRAGGWLKCNCIASLVSMRSWVQAPPKKRKKSDKKPWDSEQYGWLWELWGESRAGWRFSEVSVPRCLWCLLSLYLHFLIHLPIGIIYQGWSSQLARIHLFTTCLSLSVSWRSVYCLFIVVVPLSSITGHLSICMSLPLLVDSSTHPFLFFSVVYLLNCQLICAAIRMFWAQATDDPTQRDLGNKKNVL